MNDSHRPGMDRVRLRPMLLRDYALVARLWRETPGMHWDDDCDSRTGIRRYLRRNPGLSLVACEGECIVGAVLVGHDGRRGQLHHLAVAKDRRRRGIARALVQRALAGLARQHIPKCSIFVFRGNRSGTACWKHLGWRTRPDLHLMQHETDA